MCAKMEHLNIVIIRTGPFPRSMTGVGFNNGTRAFPPGLPFYVPAEKIPHQGGYLVAILFESEVSRVEQVKLQVLQVSPVRLGAGCRKYLVVLSPDDEGRRLVVTKVGLPFRIHRRIAAVA